MSPKSAVLLATALLVSACAQVPTTEGDHSSGDAAMAARMPGLDDAVAVPESTGTAEAAEQSKLTSGAAKPAMAAAPPANLWERIRNGFAMKNLDNPLVHEWEQWYSSRPDYVARMVDRSSRLLYHIVEEVERRKMPMEIALLPMIESAYNPRAYSTSHASGIWQFIPSTAKLYGLKRDWWYDGRRDIIAATNAALDYLGTLYGMFGDWELALAAYNWGEGAVSRAIAKNQANGLPTDYESLTMPAETRGYVPKLQAVKNIITDPARFGLQLAEIPNEPYFATVETRQHIDVKLAAQFADMPLEEFKFLNPAHNKPVIKADGSETIVLPKEKVQSFLDHLAHSDRQLVSWQVHTVKAGEKPEKIAARQGITLSRLKEINNIHGGKKIAKGETLLVPVHGDAEPNLPDLPAVNVPLPKAVKAARYAKNRPHVATRKVAHHGGAVRKVNAKSSRQRIKRVKVTIRVASRSTKKVMIARQP